jgi:hypothetical protein
MQAVLVAGIDTDKVYYILDAKAGEKDGAIVRESGNVVMVNFLPWVLKTKNLKKITNTPFHKFLWDTKANPMNGSWYETFVDRSKEFSKEMLDGLIIQTSIGKKEKSLKTKNDRAIEFVGTKEYNKMVKSSSELNSHSDQKKAWAVIAMLSSIEENDGHQQN